MRKLIFVTSFIIAISMIWQGCTRLEKTGSIHGTVTDFETGEPIENAYVSIYPGTQSLQTGYDGMFVFSDLPSRQYMVSCEKTGYESNRMTVNVEGNSVCINLLLRKDFKNVISDE